MRLDVLLAGLLPPAALPPGAGSMDISCLTDRADRAGPGSLFVCIRGCRTDGHTLAPQAWAQGCRAFLVERPPDLPAGAAVIRVADTRAALSLAACRFYGEPSRALRVVGVTGTKGKTTTACLLRHILARSGIPCGYIGTNGIEWGETRTETRNTTPDPLTLQQALHDMLRAGCRAAVLEVSSQALKQRRADGTRLAAAVFTNLSPDHIGPTEHPDFADYAACKHRLFTDFGAGLAVCNADDPHAADMLRGSSAARQVACSTRRAADYAAQDIRPEAAAGGFGVRFALLAGGRRQSCFLPLVGRGNVADALLAVACAAECFGIPPGQAAGLLGDARIAGRSETLRLANGATAVIDYAHNGVSLRQLLGSLREYRPARLICLFGSVGGRTALRREELGRAAAELADLCILTSDNPGSEPPEQIIADIARAFAESTTPYLCIPDRAEAIRTAVSLARPGDILVLAGKGHERYQLIGNEKHPFNERSMLR